MLKSRLILVILSLFAVAACGSASGPSAAVSPSPAAASPSPQIAHDSVLVGFTQNPATITLFKMDGSVVKTMPGYPVGDEHVINAFLVMTTETGGQEFTVDSSGVTRPVAPAASKILTPAAPGYPIIIDHTTAIIGCAEQGDGSCTAEVVNMDTGRVRALLKVAGTGAASMQLGPSLSLLDISPDLGTIWLRRVTSASSVQADIVGIDLRTGAMKSFPLPAKLVQDQFLAISRDGSLVAGREEAGTDPNQVAVQHLHVASLISGVDTDVQGNAPYVAGGRPPQIQFAPDGHSVAWWGSLNGAFNSGPGDRLNVASTSGGGATLWLKDTTDVHVTYVTWLNDTTLLAQVGPAGSTATINVKTGAVETLKGSAPYLAAVLV